MSESSTQPAATGVPDGGRREALLDYVCSWFTYHASQRMQSFNFFLALQTALIAVVALQLGNARLITLLFIGATALSSGSYF